MINCPAFSEPGRDGIAAALRNIDCISGQAVEIGFARIFGDNGVLSQALTLILTIYVALLALSLLTGRSQLRLNMLTPRMLQLGLVLTFATSWVAYQTVAWNLLTGAPDQIASVLIGTKGSATQLFAQRLDRLFDVIANSAHLSQSANSTATVGIVPQIANTSPKPADLLWAASLLLLLGTVGVLIVARIALAAVMALGPVFIVLALFTGTRPLFEGWIKAALMLALTPMLAVLLGGGTLMLIAPMIQSLANAGGNVSLDLATSIFLAAFVYTALMVLAMRAAAMITGGWHLGRSSEAAAEPGDAALVSRQAGEMGAAMIPAAAAGAAPSGAAPGDERVREMVRSVGLDQGRITVAAANDTGPAASDRRTAIAMLQAPVPAEAISQSGRDPRIRTLGQGFRAPQRVSL